MKRTFDILLSLFLIITSCPVLLVVTVLVKITSKGPALFWSERVGKNSVNFLMPKFRTMNIETPNVATHLLSGSESYITPIGSFLRKTSLDELPQLWSIIIGKMSFVGPRPALYNQSDLIGLRREKGVDILVPGLTGWAQINGRDELPISEKVELDVYYLKNHSFLFDLTIIFKTFAAVLGSKGISH